MTDNAAEMEDPVKVPTLDSRGRLVKRWRLTGKLNTVRVQDVIPGSRKWHEAGFYLDPGTGRFYARVPETAEGALYVEDRLRDLRWAVREALKTWANRHAPEDTRVWERRIRVGYPQPIERCGEWRKASAEQPRTNIYARAYEDPGWFTPRPTGRDIVRLSDAMGPLTFTRIERAPRPDGRWDVREWSEDYAVRMRRWEQRREPSKDQKKPVRKSAVEHGDRLLRLYSGDTTVRCLPWSQETWDSLHVFQAKIRAMDRVIREFLVGADEADFLARLHAMPSLPMLESAD